MKLQSTLNQHTTVTLLWGCKIGEPNYKEEILYECQGYVNTDELMSKGEKWARDNGYNRLRISQIDLSTPPNFNKTIEL